MDLWAAFDRPDAKREKREPRRQFGTPRFKSRRRATPAFALWNDQSAVTNHFHFDARPRATMRVPLLGEVRLREAVPGVGGILGCRVSDGRGRWCASIQFDTDWVDGERSNKAELIARAKVRKVAVAEGDAAADGREPDTPEPAAGTEVVRTRPVRVLPRHPRPTTVGAVDVGIVDVAVVNMGEGAPARHAGHGRSRPDRRAVAPDAFPPCPHLTRT